MTALTIVKFDSGFVDVERGALYELPVEFHAGAQMAFYAACKAGWSICPLGYQTYSALDAMGRKFVVPGIYVPGEPAPKRKFPNYQIRFAKQAIEAFLKPHLEVSEEVRSQRDSEFKNLTHDLRAISSEIYHSALAAKSIAEQRGSLDLAQSITALIDAQQMMSLRLDIIDYESAHSSSRPKEYVSVYKKTEKVLKCFQNKFVHRRMTYRIEGRQRFDTYGPGIYEIIPFVITENAIKYAPFGSELLVRFEETDKDIITRFESLGPRISDNEKSRIFNKNFRGQAAAESKRSGSGIGLYAAKTLVESQFNGKVFVNQVGEPLFVDGDSYFTTRFTVVVPIVASPSPIGAVAPRKRRVFRTLR